MNLPRPVLKTSGRDYDAIAKMLHWSIAALVIVNFVLAEFWDDFPRPAKHLMITAHMSFGILLTLALIAAIAWRLRGGKRHQAANGMLEVAAKAMHHLLYALLALQMLLGFATRWTDNHPLSFFGLLIPSPFGTFSKSTGHWVDQIHGWTAWTLVILAAGHAVAALVHHFVWRDNVLRGMLPGGKRPGTMPGPAEISR